MDKAYELSREEAGRFLLRRHGLWGAYRFHQKEGVMGFIRMAGCIQYDPIDVCGKNPELVLQSRVEGFQKPMLYELLYKERRLVDYFDKNLSIFAVEDWKYFERIRLRHREWERSHQEIRRVEAQVKEYICKHGPVCSGDLGLDEKVNWYWSHTKLSRAALEHLYFTGELAIHHKKGTNKYYDLIENCFPMDLLNQEDPYPDEYQHKKWRVLRRIRSIGLLWSRSSDAWLNINGLKGEERKRIFSELEQENKILQVHVDGIREPLYFPAEDLELMEEIRRGTRCKKRCELIAPLDNLLWDRRLIAGIFGFEYKWEIYTPPQQRRYGYYVLPVLYGASFAGRLEAVCDRKKSILRIPGIWFEPGFQPDSAFMAAFVSRLKQFAQWNGCQGVEGPEGYKKFFDP